MRRVISALGPVPNAIISADEDSLFDAAETGGVDVLQTDLLIRSLDFRLRLCLMPGEDGQALERSEILERAANLLGKYPETAAVVLVSDTDRLLSKLIDTPDVELLERPGLLSSKVPDALVNLVQRLMVQFNIEWSSPPRISPSLTNHGQLISELASKELKALRAGIKRTPEWKMARESLGKNETDAVQQLIAEVLAGELDPTQESLAERVRRMAGLRDD